MGTEKISGIFLSKAHRLIQFNQPNRIHETLRLKEALAL